MTLSIVAALVGQALLASASPLEVRQSSGATAFASNSDGSLQLASVDPPTLGASNDSSTSWSLSIDDSSAGYKQTITGFGGAITDATVAVMQQLDSDTLSSLLNDLLGDSGAAFSLMRHTIGASDLSADPAYTYDDSGPDTSLSSFGLGDRGTSMAQIIAQMQGVNSDLEILGTPWSAPGWMKINGELIGTTDQNNLNDFYYNTGTDYGDQYAQYLVKYLQAYQQLGANVSYLTVQNEPGNSKATMPTMYMFGEEQGPLIQNYIGPALANASLSTKIWAYDHNTDNATFPAVVLGDAGQYVNTVAWHCYANPLDWTVLSQFNQDHQGVDQYMTECYTPPVGNGGNWYDAASFTYGPLQNWAKGAIAWTLGSDSSYGPHLSGSDACSNCQGLFTVDNGQYTLQQAYYHMAQYSRGLPRGTIVLSGTGSYSFDANDGVQSVAGIQPNGTRAVVITNLYNYDKWIQLNTTSNEQWGGIVPAESTTTWLLPPLSS